MTEENKPDSPNKPDATKTADKENKAAKPKESKGKPARRFSDEQKVTMMSDSDQKKFGPENNPKRSGSESAARFAMYKDGMTVKDAKEAGIKSADLSWDVDHGYIDIK